MIGGATERRKRYVGRSPVYYFTSRMPQHATGSSLRLQYAPPVQVPPVKCTART